MKIPLVVVTGAAAAGLTWLVACGGSVGSDLQARQAYQGLDLAVEKGMTLGFAGFNAASSANIPTQMTDGGFSGTMTVTGQVDQGSSANKGMRLLVDLNNYSDGEVVITGNPAVALAYRTGADAGVALPKLDLQLRDIPNGTFSGSLVGQFEMAGDLSGVVELDLAMTGELEDDGTGKVRRKASTTRITGTATSGSGQYAVDVTR